MILIEGLPKITCSRTYSFITCSTTVQICGSALHGLLFFYAQLYFNIQHLRLT